VIAVDSNILVYSVRGDSPFHIAASDCMRRLAEGDAAWAIAWTSIHEFIAIVTHPRIYKPATSLSDAIRQVDYWRESPSLRILDEQTGYWESFKTMAEKGRVCGPLIHDARIAALCLASGVREIWTADRDYHRFPALRVRNPLIPSN
jgi:toxin-antitoxin system PIN domain toxin